MTVADCSRHFNQVQERRKTTNRELLVLFNSENRSCQKCIFDIFGNRPIAGTDVW